MVKEFLHTTGEDVQPALSESYEMSASWRARSIEERASVVRRVEVGSTTIWLVGDPARTASRPDWTRREVSGEQTTCSRRCTDRELLERSATGWRPMSKNFSSRLFAEPAMDGFAFLEGPRWHRGALYFSDFYTHCVHRLDDSGLQTLCIVDSQPSGLGFDHHGRLLVVSMLDQRVLRLIGDDLHEVANLSGILEGPANDMVVDRNGGMYVGCFGAPAQTGDERLPTTIARVEPDGTASVAADFLTFPNGMVITPDGGTLVVAESFAYRLTAFDIFEDGTLANRRIWADLTEVPAGTDSSGTLLESTVVPDGICLDANGDIWVADAANPRALCVREGGQLIAEVDTGELCVMSVVLGGDDLKTLYLCCAPASGSDRGSDVRTSVLMRAIVTVPSSAAAIDRAD